MIFQFVITCFLHLLSWHVPFTGVISCMSAKWYVVDEMQVQDSSPFSIGFSSDAGPISLGLNNVLFPKGQHIPSTKVLSFQRNSLFHLEAVYTNLDELPPGMSSKIGCFTVCSVLSFLFRYCYCYWSSFSCGAGRLLNGPIVQKLL